MMDRHAASVPKQQIGFYNFVVRPMFEAFDLLVPLELPLSNLDIMQAYWSEQLPPQDSAVVSPPPKRISAMATNSTSAAAPAPKPPS
mmetsp:Transcript_35894/g.59490  ORF Transcript_35894/g.59490 Transcript_35894/m.59490 type:complete len:87 (-) Transcript_35894:259-519(-)